MGTGTTLRKIINMTTDSQIIDHPKRWKYMYVALYEMCISKAFMCNALTRDHTFFHPRVVLIHKWTERAISVSRRKRQVTYTWPAVTF